MPRKPCGCVQVAVRNNQQGVLYFSAPFKPEVLAAQSSASSTDFFVRSPPHPPLTGPAQCLRQTNQIRSYYISSSHTRLIRCLTPGLSQTRIDESGKTYEVILPHKWATRIKGRRCCELGGQIRNSPVLMGTATLSDSRAEARKFLSDAASIQGL